MHIVAETTHRESAPPWVWDRIAAGRGALAQFTLQDGISTRRIREEEPVARLLSLLWHEQDAIRRAAALALSGGDHGTAYSPPYGYFAGALLRGLGHRTADAPKCAETRYGAVSRSLCALLDQNAVEIRGMGNMRYSFLSSALYLALLSTCRDAVEAVRRLRVAAAHPELCRLLWNLSRQNVTRRLNSQDSELLAQTAGRAMGALPPDEIPEFWSYLTHSSLPRRQAVALALAHISDSRAVPYLIAALPGQPPALAEPIIACLGRLGDPRALPVLLERLQSRDGWIRQQARAAIAAIKRAAAVSPERTLLRPVGVQEDETSLLRPLSAAASSEPPEELLRIGNPTDG